MQAKNLSHRLGGALNERKDHAAALGDNLPSGREHTGDLAIGLDINMVFGIDR